MSVSQVDWWVSVAAWCASLFAGLYEPHLALLTIVTTLNLGHQRHVLYNAGDELARRVRGILADELKSADDRLVLLEKGVEDVRDAQIRIAGQFRGRGAL